MRKLLVFMIVTLSAVCVLYINNLFLILQMHRETAASRGNDFYENIRNSDSHSTEEDISYKVYVNNIFNREFEDYSEALAHGKTLQNASIYESYTGAWVWDNLPPFELYANDFKITYNYFSNAIEDSRNYENSYIAFRKSGNVIWRSDYSPIGEMLLSIPNISQLPELERGCEVTSAAMLLNFKGIPVDKMTLADEIAKHENNPYKGFVGNIYTKTKPGYGVYSEPVFELIEKYLPEVAIDLTGCDFDDFFYLLDNGQPIWVIINTTYAELKLKDFVLWQTDEGEIAITYSEHSVLVSGYDEKYIYFNDPLGRRKFADKADFILCWEQMGRQAISTAY